MAGFSGNSFGDRILIGTVYSLSAMGAVLAATVALRCSDATSAESSARSPWRVWAYDSLGVIAVVSVATSGWTMVDAFVRGSGGGEEPHLEIQRFALAAAGLAPALLAVATLLVVAAARRRVRAPDTVDVVDAVEPVDVEAAVAEPSDDPASDAFRPGLVGPTVASLLAAAIVSIAVAVTSAFAGSTFPGGFQGAPERLSFGDRIAAISRSTGSASTAFIAFAVVVLVALGRRRQRDGETDLRVAIAGIVGLVVTIAAAYSAWVFVTVSRSSQGLLAFAARSWWERLTGASAALAAVAIGAVAAGAARALRTRDLSSKPATLRSGARVIAALLAASAAAYAAFTVLNVLGGYGLAVNDLIAEVAPYALATTALALAAALVMAASRPDVDGRDELNDAVDAVVGLVGMAALAVSGYSIWFILFARHTGRLSLFAHANAAERLSQAGAWVPVALLGAAALHLIVRGRQVDADFDTEREIEALDLLS
jgi:hypothetical protein